MGTYCYTLRTQTKTVDGMTIGRLSYAYKYSFWRESGAYRRRVAIMESHADNARYKNPDLEYVILGEFSNAEKEKIPVFKIPKTLITHMDSSVPGTLVGYLSKHGRKYIFENYS